MNLLRHHIIIIVFAIAVGVGILAYALWGVTGPGHSGSVAVTRMSLTEAVTGEGSVKAAEAVDLGFEHGGKISHVDAQVGDHVGAGATIATLDASDLEAQLAQAEADVATQQANLDALKTGARPEDIQASEIKVSNATTALDTANTALANALQSAYAVADDAVRTKSDPTFSNPRSSNPQFFSLTDSNLKSTLESERASLETVLTAWLAAPTPLDTSEVNKNLNQVGTFLGNEALALNSLSSSGSVPAATVSVDQANISLARTAVNASIAAVAAADQGVKSAQATLDSSKQDLVLKQSGATAAQLAAGEAGLARAEATQQLAQVALAKSSLTSPISGIVSRQDAKVGAIATPNQTLVSVLSGSNYQIEIYVSETDIGKILVGEKAAVTLDAYGSNVPFDATVVKTDPAATMQNGVSAYKVTLQFAKSDERIKVGMAANVTITTADKSNVLAVPTSALITRGADKIVLVERSGATPEERKVVTGITGANGYTEIVSGLHEGDQVATFGNQTQ